MTASKPGTRHDQPDSPTTPNAAPTPATPNAAPTPATPNAAPTPATPNAAPTPATPNAAALAAYAERVDTARGRPGDHTPIAVRDAEVHTLAAALDLTDPAIHTGLRRYFRLSELQAHELLSRLRLAALASEEDDAIQPKSSS